MIVHVLFAALLVALALATLWLVFLLVRHEVWLYRQVTRSPKRRR